MKDAANTLGSSFWDVGLLAATVGGAVVGYKKAALVGALVGGTLGGGAVILVAAGLFLAATKGQV